MARILYASFDRVPAPKGASRHIAALVGGLVAAGHEVDLVVPGPGLDLAGVTNHPAPDRGGDNFLVRAGAFGEHVAAVARAGGHDLWHTRSVWEGLPLAILKDGHGGPPLVAEVNGLASIELVHHFARLANTPDVLRRLRRQEMAWLGAADAILTPSAITAACLAELGLPAGRTTVVPNGVDGALFAASGDDAGPIITYLGTFAPWQGLSTLLRAMRRVPPPARLRLVGPPGKGWAHDLRRLAAGLGVADRVLFHPPVAPELVPAVLAAARVCVAPLDGSARNMVQGCCPLKVLEYMAAGRAVVASRLPAVEALATHDVEAWLVPPDDPDALAAGLNHLLADGALRDRLAAAGRQRAASSGWDAANDTVLAVYASLGARVS